MSDRSNVVYIGSKQPVMVKAPCGFCGNNPPYACPDCNETDDSADGASDGLTACGSVLIPDGRKWIGSGDSGWLAI